MRRTFKEIDTLLSDRIKTIFSGYDIDNLSNYEKRKIIFNYVCQHGKYDFNKLENIKNHGSRDLFDDLYSAMDEKESICNAFAQYYKLLLEKVDIYSLCVCCDDGTEVKHQLNLVRNDDDTYSFDDTTSVIVGRGTVDDFFDYDIKEANNLNQGNKVVFDDIYWLIMPTEMVYYLIGKNDKSYRMYGVESGDSIISLPSKISSFKNIVSQSRKM